MRADAHVHLFSQGFLGTEGRVQSIGSEVETYNALRERQGISRALIVGFEGAKRYWGNNKEILKTANRAKWAVPLAYLSRVPSASQVRCMHEAGHAGFSIYPGISGTGVAPWPVESVDALNEESSIFSVNAGPEELDQISGLLERLDATSVLISHLGLPGAGSPDQLRRRLGVLLRLAKFKQVYVKLSGLYAIDPEYPHWGAQPVVETVLEAFGTGRVLWGSDFAPVLDYVGQDRLFDPPTWCETLLSTPEREAVLGTNLLRILDGK